MSTVDSFDKPSVPLRLVPGRSAGGGMISVGGVVQPAVWLDHVITARNERVHVLFIDRGDFTSQAVVVGRTGAAQAREGTVISTGTDTATVDAGGVTVKATVLESYAPSSGDLVRLLWQGAEATVLGKVGSIEPPETTSEPTGATPPPPPAQGGHKTFTASDSATWSGSLYRWNSHYGKDVYQGNGSTWGAPSTNNGAWFYHDKPSAVQGKPGKRVELWVPARQRAGGYNSAGTLNVFLHSSKRKPSGDVSRSSSTTLSIPAGWSGGYRDLPTGWFDNITDGAGIGISGGTYMGFNGVKKGSSTSGQLRMTWG